MKLNKVKWSYEWVNKIVNKYGIYVTLSMTGYQQDVMSASAFSTQNGIPQQLPETCFDYHSCMSVNRAN